MKRYWAAFVAFQLIGHGAAWLLLTWPLAGQYLWPLLITTFIGLFPGNMLAPYLAQHTLSGAGLGVFTRLWATDALVIAINATVWLLILLAYRRIRRGKANSGEVAGPASMDN
jgi:hypothetical protein